ncbi:protein ALP1-like [Actinidia eriantha]|uniref:protein ALP1-like n=1 Tax=Actinidia eriantha TaxID=165200 RepID=UPI00258889FD|nr:protein ALP1-like [Actinidia eriantha]
MAADYCRPTRDQNDVHPYIAHNRRYRPFKDCIGAIDGTHVEARLPPEKAVPYFGRKGCHTQNIMAACDFDMCFIFVSAGWEGSMHDTRIFYNVVLDTNKNFPYPQEDKYYLVDAGYPNRKGFLAPYKGERYHQAEFQRGEPPSNANEQFNKVHSSLRSVIERSFGVWKNRWAILRSMPQFCMSTQTAIVGGSMAIHNFIRRNSDRDPYFDRIEDMEEFYLSETANDGSGSSSSGSSSRTSSMPDDDGSMSDQRDFIRQKIVRQVARQSGR